MLSLFYLISFFFLPKEWTVGEECEAQSQLDGIYYPGVVKRLSCDAVGNILATVAFSEYEDRNKKIMCDKKKGVWIGKIDRGGAGGRVGKRSLVWVLQGTSSTPGPS